MCAFLTVRAILGHVGGASIGSGSDRVVGAAAVFRLLLASSFLFFPRSLVVANSDFSSPDGLFFHLLHTGRNELLAIKSC
jgi:hypothetical protein